MVSYVLAVSAANLKSEPFTQYSYLQWKILRPAAYGKSRRHHRAEGCINDGHRQRHLPCCDVDAVLPALTQRQRNTKLLNQRMIPPDCRRQLTIGQPAARWAEGFYPPPSNRPTPVPDRVVAASGQMQRPVPDSAQQVLDDLFVWHFGNGPSSWSLRRFGRGLCVGHVERGGCVLGSDRFCSRLNC